MAVIVAVIRKVALGVAFGFIMINILSLVIGQGPEQVALCIFLTLVVTIAYLISIWSHVVQSIKIHLWKELFTGLV